jgi:hypothetical protein
MFMFGNMSVGVNIDARTPKSAIAIESTMNV